MNWESLGMIIAAAVAFWVLWHLVFSAIRSIEYKMQEHDNVIFKLEKDVSRLARRRPAPIDIKYSAGKIARELKLFGKSIHDQGDRFSRNAALQAIIFDAERRVKHIEKFLHELRGELIAGPKSEERLSGPIQFEEEKDVDTSQSSSNH